ncbi:hypothetical protein J4457_02580 [Candidatus Woesearchaeota archaeon]|nr:hypothetical protein [Candidatus Woesearchaeota archaeon]
MTDSMSRRGFLGLLGAGALTILGVRDATAEEFSPERIKKLINSLEKSIEKDRLSIDEVRKKTEESFTFRKKYLLKYGTSEKPVLGIRDDYTFEPIEYEPFPFVQVNKDQEYLDLLAQMAELTNIIRVDDLRLFQFLGLKDYKKLSFAPLEELIGEESFQREHYFKPGEAWVVDSPTRLVAFLETVSNEELYNFDEPHYNFLNNCAYRALLTRIQQADPELQKTIGDTSKVAALLAPYARKVIAGHDTAWPTLVVHPDNETFLASSTGIPDNAVAFHNVVADTIETFAKPGYEHLFDLSHEYGHPIGRTSENAKLSSINKLEECITYAEKCITDKREIVDRLKLLQKESDPAKKKELEQEIERELFTIRLRAFADNLGVTSKTLSSLDEKTEENIHNQLDEAVAYLTQDILFQEYARANPAIGRLLLQYRDFHTSVIAEVSHYGAFALAKELKAKHQEDSVAALQEIVQVSDEAQIKVYENKIRSYNEQISRDMLLGIDFGRMGASDNVRAAIDRNLDALKMEWEEKRDDPEHLVQAKTRFLENQKRLVDLYKRFMKYSKPR